MITVRACINCKFYQNGVHDGVGECRLQPPQIEANHNRWPVMHDNDWCGQFSAKDQPPGAGEEQDLIESIQTTRTRY